MKKFNVTLITVKIIGRIPSNLKTKYYEIELRGIIKKKKRITTL